MPPSKATLKKIVLKRNVKKDQEGWKRYDIYYDGIYVGKGYRKKEIFYLDRLNLKKHDFHGKGIGTQIVWKIIFLMVELVEHGYLFATSPEKDMEGGLEKSSQVFYDKLGFADFDKTNDIEEEEKEYYEHELDHFCSTQNLKVLSISKEFLS